MKKSVFLSALILMFFFFSCFESFAGIDLVYSKGSPAHFAFFNAKFSPNGKKIAAGLEGANSDTNVKIIIYNSSNGDSLMELKGHHGSFIGSITWLNDSILASGDSDNEYFQKRTLILWNVISGEILHTFFDSDTLFPWHIGVKEIVSLKDKNKLLVSLWTIKSKIINQSPPWKYVYWHDTVLVINPTTYEIIKPLSFSDTNDYHDISLICGAPDGGYYVLYENHQNQLRNSDNDSIIWKSDSASIFPFNQISLNGKYGVCSISNAIIIYDIENRVQFNNFQFDSINNPQKSLISPDSKYIAIIGYYENDNYKRRNRFGVAEIENISNQEFQDSIICERSFEASNDSLYILCLNESNLNIYSAPWSPKNTNVEDKNEAKDFLIISPNPAEDYIEISVGARHAFTNTDIRIFNVFGEILKNLSPSLSEGEEIIYIYICLDECSNSI